MTNLAFLCVSVVQDAFSLLPRTSHLNICHRNQAESSRTPRAHLSSTARQLASIPPPQLRQRSPPTILLLAPTARQSCMHPQSRSPNLHPRSKDHKSSAQSRSPYASRLQSRETENPAVTKCI